MNEVAALLRPFKNSDPFTFGIELEMQIVNTYDYDLTKAASDVLRVVKSDNLHGQIKLETTESMVELATGVCTRHAQALDELRSMRAALVSAADFLNVGVCGGGTHAFQNWQDRKTNDLERSHQLSELYGYLYKQFTVFGQHVHIGCPTADSALYLLHAISRFIPHFIALAASSPFVQGVDTGFHSARLNSISAFPLSGPAPYFLTWESFGAYFARMAQTGLVDSMKDFYWDIRPSPGYGTIEVRVMDTPLSVERAAAIACYIQTLARYLLLDKPFMPREEDYLVYAANRFMACRFGLDGVCVNPETGITRSIADDITVTLEALGPHAEALESQKALELVSQLASGRINDATDLRRNHQDCGSLHEVVRQQCNAWRG